MQNNLSAGSKNINIEQPIHKKTERLTQKLNKDYLDCNDLMLITGLGRDNVRTMMARQDFPLMRVGNLNVVSIALFVMWQLNQYMKI